IKIFVCVFLGDGCFFIPANTQASIIAHKIKQGSVIFTLDKGLMQVTVCKADIIEVKYTIFNSFSDKPSLVVNNKWQYPAFKLTENKYEYIITTTRLKVLANKSTNPI